MVGYGMVCGHLCEPHVCACVYIRTCIIVVSVDCTHKHVSMYCALTSTVQVKYLNYALMLAL